MPPFRDGDLELCRSEQGRAAVRVVEGCALYPQGWFFPGTLLEERQMPDRFRHWQWSFPTTIVVGDVQACKGHTCPSCRHGAPFCVCMTGCIVAVAMVSSAPQYTEDREQSSNARHISSEGQRSISRLLFSVKARAGISREAIHPRPVPLRSDAVAEQYQIGGCGNLDWRCGLAWVHPHQTARPSF